MAKRHAVTTPDPSADEHIQKRPLAKRLGVSPWTVDRYRRSGDFPEPFWLAAVTPVWRWSEIRAWLERRRAAKAPRAKRAGGGR